MEQKELFWTASHDQVAGPEIAKVGRRQRRQPPCLAKSPPAGPAITGCSAPTRASVDLAGARSSAVCGAVCGETPLCTHSRLFQLPLTPIPSLAHSHILTPLGSQASNAVTSVAAACQNLVQDCTSLSSNLVSDLPSKVPLRNIAPPGLGMTNVTLDEF